MLIDLTELNFCSSLSSRYIVDAFSEAYLKNKQSLVSASRFSNESRIDIHMFAPRVLFSISIINNDNCSPDVTVPPLVSYPGQLYTSDL